MKETFDIDTIPSIRLLKGDKVYHCKWVNGVWTTAEIASFVANHEETALFDYSRPRVSDGIFLSVEYVLNSLAANNFNYAMENYLFGKKLVFEWTGYKHDLKSINPNMGKKNTFKKSQMRTLLTYVIGPAVFVGIGIGALVVMGLFAILSWLCCSGERVDDVEWERKDGSKVKDE